MNVRLLRMQVGILSYKYLYFLSNKNVYWINNNILFTSLFINGQFIKSRDFEIN